MEKGKRLIYHRTNIHPVLSGKDTKYSLKEGKIREKEGGVTCEEDGSLVRYFPYLGSCFLDWVLPLFGKLVP